MVAVRTHYLDTSALMRFLDPGHPSSAAMVTYLRDNGLMRRGLWASRLTHLEAARVAARERDAALRDLVDALFAVAIDSADIDQRIVARAMAFTEHLRSLDAIHLATALSVSPSQTLITYDRRLTAAAHAHGLTVVAP